MGKKIVFIMVLLGFALTAFAQIEEQRQTEDEELKKSYLYQWTDDKGGVHITDGLGKVPKRYREKAVKLEQQKTEGSDQGQQKQAPLRSFSAPRHGQTDEAGKAEWQERMRAAKQRLVNAEKRYNDLDKERTGLLGVMGSAAMAPIANRVRAEELAEEMKDVRNEIDDARNTLEVVLPEEARKAGVPPGWLRE